MARPKSKPISTRSIQWNNLPLYFTENPTISNCDLGSCTRWCKKIFSITRAYIICESSSIPKTFNHSHCAFGLKILNSSNKFIKSLHNNQYSDLIAYRIKLLSGTLPTREFLNQLYPNLYTDPYCPRCNLHTENIQHTFKCPSADKETKQIIETINSILITNNNPSPILTIWQVIELACGITSNIYSTSNLISWSKASTEALTLSYNLIWKPRCNTANTSPSTGIKWDKTKIQKHHKSKSNSNSHNINKSISSQESNLVIDIPTLITETFIQSKFNYSSCISNLISKHHDLISSNSE